MVDVAFFRRQLARQGGSMPCWWRSLWTRNRLLRVAPRTFLLLLTVCFQSVAISPKVAAQSLSDNLSEIIRKRLEVRKPPEPEITFSPAEPLDPNGMPEADAMNTETQIPYVLDLPSKLIRFIS